MPETLVTNDPEAARQFCAVHHDGVVYKTIASGFVEYLPTVTGTIYTTLLEQKHLAELDRVEVVPCLFQEYVAKAVELRVTVVGTEVFAAQIDSQATERTKHDWRRYDSATPYSQHRLPQDEEERCVTLVRCLGLEFGAIDLVLRPDGRYVFLEINANGQWGWIEQLTGFPIAAAIADRLIEKGDCLGRVMTA